MDRRVGWALSAVALVLLLVVGSWVVGTVRSVFDPFDLGRGDYSERGTTVVERLRDLSELTTIEAVEATTIERGNDRGILNFVLGDRIAMLVVAKVGAGVDLSMLDEDDVVVDFEARSIQVRLPDPRILYVEIDEDATRVYDRDTGVFTKGDPQLESQARRIARDVLEEDAIGAGLLDEARRSARTTVGDFLRAVGFEQVQVGFAD